jgi:RNA recognition motif-containing protein
MEPYFEGARLKNKSESFHVRRIFISNIPQEVTNSELEQAFAVYGKVESAYRIVTSNQEKKPFGFILFHDQSSAIACNSKRNLRIRGVLVCCRYFKKRDEVVSDAKVNSNLTQGHFKTRGEGQMPSNGSTKKSHPTHQNLSK